MKRTSLWKVLRILLAALVLLAGSCWLWIRSLESRGWARLEKRVAQLHSEMDARCGPRPILRGTPIPGNAWDDYLQGIEIARKIDDFSVFKSKADPSKTRAALEKYGLVLTLLQKGTRRAECRRMRFYEEENPFELADDTRLGYSGRLAFMATCRARQLKEDGKSHEAMELLLDLCQFAQDIARDGTTNAWLTGFTFQSLALEGLRELLIQGTLAREHCIQLAQELAPVEERFPRIDHANLGQLEWYGQWILDDRMFSVILQGKPLPPEARPGWRHAFSMRLVLISGFEQADASFRILNSEEGSQAQETARVYRFHQDLKTSKNWVAEMFGSMVIGGGSWRRQKVQMRLLRMGAHYSGTGEILVIDDPMGSTFFHRKEETQLRLWGVGMNGKNDGGKGSFTGNMGITDDMTLEVPYR